MNVILDFETRSPVDLPGCGAYVYAEHPKTDVLCAAWKFKGTTHLWTPHLTREECEVVFDLPWSPLEELLALSEDPEILFHAHNANFERCIWRHVLTRYGASDIPVERWRCSAAQAAVLALPRSLDHLASVLKAPMQKDREGYLLMKKYSRPTAKGEWLTNKADLARIFQYCIQDVLTEEAVEDLMPPMTEHMQRLWEMDQRVNDRGIPVDPDEIRQLLDRMAIREKELLDRVSVLTNGKIHSARQTKALQKWLAEEGLDLPDIRKATVLEALNGMGDGNKREILEIRQSLGKSSTGKLAAMLKGLSHDNRLRGLFVFGGATTGRHIARRVQPHNFPRDSFSEEQFEEYLLGGSDLCALKAASKCLRPLLRVESACDFSAVEGVFTAWLAEELHILDAYREGLDTYKVAASGVFNCGYDEVDDKMRQIGKVIELACGYQGYVGAFLKMADNVPAAKRLIDAWGLEKLPDEVDLLTDEMLRAGQKELTPRQRIEEHAGRIIQAWRKSRPATVALWRGIGDAAVKTVKTGLVHSYGRIKFGIKDDYLFCRLPSGRYLSYPFPSVKTQTDKYGRTRDAVAFWTMVKVGNREVWMEDTTYGGKLVENIVQGMGWDRLMWTMGLLEMVDYDLFMHVHDEAGGGRFPGSKETMEAIFRINPSWCHDLPLGAKGWIGRRYRKD